MEHLDLFKKDPPFSRTEHATRTGPRPARSELARRSPSPHEAPDLGGFQGARIPPAERCPAERRIRGEYGGIPLGLMSILGERLVPVNINGIVRA